MPARIERAKKLVMMPRVRFSSASTSCTTDASHTACAREVDAGARKPALRRWLVEPQGAHRWGYLLLREGGHCSPSLSLGSMPTLPSSLARSSCRSCLARSPPLAPSSSLRSSAFRCTMRSCKRRRRLGTLCGRWRRRKRLSCVKPLFSVSLPGSSVADGER